MTAGAGAERFVDRWLALDDTAKDSGLTDCSYWPWYGEKRNFQVGQMVFSFIQIGYDEWLFISAATITGMLPGQRAAVAILERYKGYFGRLVISYKIALLSRPTGSAITKRRYGNATNGLPRTAI